MTLILDTSGLYAALNPAERRHGDCVAAIAGATPPYVLSPFVLAELDYLLLTRASIDHELMFLGEVARGAYQLAFFTAKDVERARDIADTYRDLALGIADASILVLCERLDEPTVLTLDERHFRAVTSAGRPIWLLPADGS